MRTGRRGFSLLEVILAAGILLACLVVLGQLASEGRHHIDDIETLSGAELACQTRLNEILCGATPLEAVEDEPLADLPGWVVSVAVEPLERQGVSALRVTVSEERDEESAGAEDRPAGPKFTLVRWVRDTTAGDEEAGDSRVPLLDGSRSSSVGLPKPRAFERQRNVPGDAP